MDDSDQDFSFLCSRLLKRVRRKGGQSGDEIKTVVKDEGADADSGSRIQSRSKAPCKRKREEKKKKEALRSNVTHRNSTEGMRDASVKGGEQKVTMQFISSTLIPFLSKCYLQILSLQDASQDDFSNVYGPGLELLCCGEKMSQECGRCWIDQL